MRSTAPRVPNLEAFSAREHTASRRSVRLEMPASWLDSLRGGSTRAGSMTLSAR